MRIVFSSYPTRTGRLIVTMNFSNTHKCKYALIASRKHDLVIVQTASLHRVGGTLYFEDEPVSILNRSNSLKTVQKIKNQFACRCVIQPLIDTRIECLPRVLEDGEAIGESYMKNAKNINYNQTEGLGLEQSENSRKDDITEQTNPCLFPETTNVGPRATSSLLFEGARACMTRNTDIILLDTDISIAREEEITTNFQQTALSVPASDNVTIGYKPVHDNASQVNCEAYHSKETQSSVVSYSANIEHCYFRQLIPEMLEDLSTDEQTLLSPSVRIEENEAVFKSNKNPSIECTMPQETKIITGSQSRSELSSESDSESEPEIYRTDGSSDEYLPSDSNTDASSSEDLSNNVQVKATLSSVKRKLFAEKPGCSRSLEDVGILNNSADELDEDGGENRDAIGLIKIVHGEQKVHMLLYETLHQGCYANKLQALQADVYYVAPIKSESPSIHHKCEMNPKPKCVFQYSLVSMEGKLNVNSCINTHRFHGTEIELGEGACVVNFTAGNELDKTVKKNHHCIYCQKKLKYLTVHLKRSHATEREVVDAMKSSNKRKAFGVLANKGDRLHDGHLSPSQRIPLRLSDKSTDEERVQCSTCYGMLRVANYAKHERRCSGRSANYSRVLIKASDAEVSRKVEDPESYEEMRAYCYKDLLKPMHTDKVGHIVRTDFALRIFGMHFAIKASTKINKAKNVRMQLRLLARILREVQTVVPGIIDFRDVISGEGYEILLYAVMKVIGQDIKRKRIKKTSVALLIRSCVTNLAESLAIYYQKRSENDASASKELSRVETFLAIHRSKEFTNSISTLAHSERAIVRLLHAKTVPSIADISKFTIYVKSEAEKAAASLEKEPFEYKTWLKLGKAIIILLLTFNRRRIGETSSMLLQLYQQRFTVTGDDYEHLNRLELLLANKFFIMKLVGKRVRHLTILLSEDHVKLLDVLVKHRVEAGVPDTNRHLFGVRTDDMYMDASNDLRKYSILCGADNPEALRATLLRRQIATCAQLLQISENELRQITDFMGHSFEVHMKSYRSAEAVQQITVISKFLMAIGDRNISRFKGKNLQDIELEMAGEDSDDCDNTERSLINDPAEVNPGNQEGDNAEPNATGLYTDPHEPDSRQSVGSSTPKKTARNKSKIMVSPKRIPWAPQEIELIRKHFGGYIDRGQYPEEGMSFYANVLEKHRKVFHPKRSLSTLYSYVQYRIRQNRK